MAKPPFANHTLAPVPPDMNVERRSNVYEVLAASNLRRQGERQAAEGLTDGDLAIRGQMYEGVREGELTAPGSQNHNPRYHRQDLAVTTGQRARMGGAGFHTNASWVNVDGFLRGFAHGASGDGEQRYETDRVSGYRYGTPNEARLRDSL